MKKRSTTAEAGMQWQAERDDHLMETRQLIFVGLAHVEEPAAPASPAWLSHRPWGAKLRASEPRRTSGERSPASHNFDLVSKQERRH
jgi:hypothetical protein